MKLTKHEFSTRIKSFVLELVRVVDSLPNEKSSRVIADQLMRSGSSVGANYFEAQGASTRKDYANFFSYSLKSANETKFWLEILIESEKGNTSQLIFLLNEATELSKIFGASIVSLRRENQESSKVYFSP